MYYSTCVRAIFFYVVSVAVHNFLGLHILENTPLLGRGVGDLVGKKYETGRVKGETKKKKEERGKIH
jgi:hypothetical protein